jgi:thiamine-phosphate pyrophosphorylase
MHRRQPLPRLWMMTDERQGERYGRRWKSCLAARGWFSAITGFPAQGAAGTLRARKRSGPAAQPFAPCRRLGQTRSLLDVFRPHGRQLHGRRKREIRALPRMISRRYARPSAAAPISCFSRQSIRPGRTPVETARATAVLQPCAADEAPVIALGGMNRRRARALPGFVYGWAAIDAWT